MYKILNNVSLNLNRKNALSHICNAPVEW